MLFWILQFHGAGKQILLPAEQYVLKVYNMCPDEHGFWYLLLSNLLPHFEHIFYGDMLWISQCSILIVWEVLHTFLPFEGYVHRFISKYKLRKHQLLPTVYYSKPTFNTQTACHTEHSLSIRKANPQYFEHVTKNYGVDWFEPAQDRDKWPALLYTVINFL